MACFRQFPENQLRMTRFSIWLFVPLICVALFSTATRAAGETDDADWAKARAEAMKTYKGQVAPFVSTYCTVCHGGKKQKGGVNLQNAVKNPDSHSSRLLFKRAATQIKSHDMPPDDEDKQPSDLERKAIVDWIGGMKYLSPKDPGFFVIRRLNRVEYGNTLHDLFGVDPQIAHELPDEVFGAGYTNSLSPLLMEQYLAVANEAMNKIIARGIAAHRRAAAPVWRRSGQGGRSQGGGGRLPLGWPG